MDFCRHRRTCRTSYPSRLANLFWENSVNGKYHRSVNSRRNIFRRPHRFIFPNIFIFDTIEMFGSVWKSYSRCQFRHAAFGSCEIHKQLHQIFPPFFLHIPVLFHLGLYVFLHYTGPPLRFAFVRFVHCSLL